MCVCVPDQVFGLAVYHMLREALSRELTPDERFAVHLLTQTPETFPPTCTSNQHDYKCDPLLVLLLNCLQIESFQ